MESLHLTAICKPNISGGAAKGQVLQSEGEVKGEGEKAGKATSKLLVINRSYTNNLDGWLNRPAS